MKTNKKRASKKWAWLALALLGCLPAVTPCSEAEAGQDVAVCVARIQVECKPTPDGKKDTSCPVYVECKETLDKWEMCK